MPFNARPVHLKSHIPTETTVQYTISNASVDMSKTAMIVRWLRRSLKLIIAILWTAISVLQVDDTLQLDIVAEQGRIYNIQQRWIELTTATDWGKGAWVVVTILLSGASLYALARRNYVEESLLLIRSLGVQTSTSSAFYLCSPSTRFIPATQIQDIFIHEAFRGFEVRFYLAIVVKDKGDAVVVFPKLLPRRHHLEVVWRGARRVLWGRSAPTKSE